PPTKRPSARRGCPNTRPFAFPRRFSIHSPSWPPSWPRPFSFLFLRDLVHVSRPAMSMIHEPSHLWPKSRQFANDSSPLFLRSPIFLKKTSHLRLTSQNVHHTFIVYIRSLILRRGLEREHGRRNSFLD